MILYNETINIDNTIVYEWLKWIQETYIPQVMGTNSFVEFKMYRLHNEEENGGTTYCIQFFANKISEVEYYQQHYSAGIQRNHLEKFRNKFVLFSTMLESV